MRPRSRASLPLAYLGAWAVAAVVLLAAREGAFGPPQLAWPALLALYLLMPAAAVGVSYAAGRGGAFGRWAWAPILAIGVLQQALHCFTPHFYLSAIELCLSLGLSLIAFLVGHMVRRVRES